MLVKMDVGISEFSTIDELKLFAGVDSAGNELMIQHGISIDVVSHVVDNTVTVSYYIENRGKSLIDDMVEKISPIGIMTYIGPQNLSGAPVQYKIEGPRTTACTPTPLTSIVNYRQRVREEAARQLLTIRLSIYNYDEGLQDLLRSSRECSSKRGYTLVYEVDYATQSTVFIFSKVGAESDSSKISNWTTMDYVKSAHTRYDLDGCAINYKTGHFTIKGTDIKESNVCDCLEAYDKWLVVDTLLGGHPSSNTSETIEKKVRKRRVIFD